MKQQKRKTKNFSRGFLRKQKGSLQVLRKKAYSFKKFRFVKTKRGYYIYKKGRRGIISITKSPIKLLRILKKKKRISSISVRKHAWLLKGRKPPSKRKIKNPNIINFRKKSNIKIAKVNIKGRMKGRMVYNFHSFNGLIKSHSTHFSVLVHYVLIQKHKRIMGAVRTRIREKPNSMKEAKRLMGKMKTEIETAIISDARNKGLNYKYPARLEEARFEYLGYYNPMENKYWAQEIKI